MTHPEAHDGKLYDVDGELIYQRIDPSQIELKYADAEPSTIAERRRNPMRDYPRKRSVTVSVLDENREKTLFSVEFNLFGEPVTMLETKKKVWDEELMKIYYASLFSFSYHEEFTRSREKRETKKHTVRDNIARFLVSPDKVSQKASEYRSRRYPAFHIFLQHSESLGQRAKPIAHEKVEERIDAYLTMKQKKMKNDGMDGYIDTKALFHVDHFICQVLVFSEKVHNLSIKSMVNKKLHKLASEEALELSYAIPRASAAGFSTVNDYLDAHRHDELFYHGYSDPIELYRVIEFLEDNYAVLKSHSSVYRKLLDLDIETMMQLRNVGAASGMSAQAVSFMIDYKMHLAEKYGDKTALHSDAFKSVGEILSNISGNSRLAQDEKKEVLRTYRLMFHKDRLMHFTEGGIIDDTKNDLYTLLRPIYIASVLRQWDSEGVSLSSDDYARIKSIMVSDGKSIREFRINYLFHRLPIEAAADVVHQLLTIELKVINLPAHRWMRVIDNLTDDAGEYLELPFEWAVHL